MVGSEADFGLSSQILARSEAPILAQPREADAERRTSARSGASSPYLSAMSAHDVADNVEAQSGSTRPRGPRTISAPEHLKYVFEVFARYPFTGVDYIDAATPQVTVQP